MGARCGAWRGGAGLGGIRQRVRVRRGASLLACLRAQSAVRRQTGSSTRVQSQQQSQQFIASLTKLALLETLAYRGVGDGSTWYMVHGTSLSAEAARRSRRMVSGGRCSNSNLRTRKASGLSRKGQGLNNTLSGFGSDYCCHVILGQPPNRSD